MTVVINGDTGISPVTASGTSASVDGMTVGRGGGEVSTNTAVGASALQANSTAGDSVAIGYQALYSSNHTADTAARNTAVGSQAGYGTTTGSENTVYGRQAGYSLGAGSANTIIGEEAGVAVTGTLNTFLGYQSGSAITSGGKNTIIGKYNGNTGGLDIRTLSNFVVLSDGDGNPRIVVNNDGNVLIGATSASGKLTVVGVDSTGSNNAIFAKNSNGNTLFQARDDGWINLGNASVSPYNNTTGNGANMYIATDSSVQRSTSSLKYKTDVVDARFGLADVLKLRAVNYKSKNPADGNKVFGGLIAEEVEEAGLTEFVIHAEDGTPDALNYSNMVSLAFKAIQELKTIVDAQATEITALKAKVG